MTNAAARPIALRRTGPGNHGSIRRSMVSRFLKYWPQPERYGPRIQSSTCSGGRANSSGTCTPRGLRARGRSAISTVSGTITVRDQYETLSRWNGNHFGSSTSSTGITGTARHGTSPNSASCARVNTLVRSAPPAASTASRAARMCGASMSSPINLSAK